MKIAILSALPLDDPRGGAEVVAKMTADGLRDAGHEVIVIGKLTELTVSLRGVDVAITHNVRGLGWLLPRKIKKLGIRHIHVLHDVQLIEPSGIVEASRFHGAYYGTVPRTATRVVWAMLMRWIWGSPDIVIGPSQWILDVHTQWGFFKNSKLVHLQNPTITPFHPPYLKGEISSLPPLEKGELKGVRRFVFLGQLEPHKGVFDLVEAVRALPEDVRVEFVGVGSVQDELKRRTAGDPRYIFRGRVKPEDVPGVLAGAVATVVPSRCLENAPMTITQSLAVGIPVIATSVGGVPDLIHDGQNGFLVPPGDVPELARAMQSVVDGRRLNVVALEMSVQEYCGRLISLLTPPNLPLS